MKQRDEVEELRKENEQLKNELQAVGLTLNALLKDKEIAVQNRLKENSNGVLKEKEAEIQKKYKESKSGLLKENKFVVSTETWTEAMDELAHAINTDIYVATSLLRRDLNPERINQLVAHIQQIQNYTDLVMWDLDFSRQKSKQVYFDLEEVNISEVVPEVLQTIKSAPTILRPNTTERENQLRELTVTEVYNGDVTILKPIRLKTVLKLIFLELLKNSFANCAIDNPQISISASEMKDSILIEIENNVIEAEENFKDWFLGESVDSDFTVSKSGKVGLRLIIRWTNRLNIKRDIVINSAEKTIKISLTIPKVITL